MTQLHPYLQVAQPMVLAHRGDSAHAPANTRPAFSLAAACGADALETDIHWTRDGQIVVCHDETVDSVSNGRGWIKDMSLTELKKLDFGFRFTPDGGQSFPYRDKGVQILTLEELLVEFSHMRVNMDIKPRVPGSLRQLVELIYACGAQWRVLLASFHSSPLRKIRTMAPYLATSASTWEVAGFWSTTQLHLKPQRRLPYQALQVPVSMGILKVTSRLLIESAHSAAAKVHVWTVDEETEMRALFRLGVDGLVTNNPRLAVCVRQDEVFGRTDAAIGGSKWKS